MGVDITMNIIKDKQEIAYNIYDGRNSEWFDNLSSCGYHSEPAYDYLPVESYGIDEEICPKDYLEKYSSKNYYYNHRTIKVKDFLNWYIKYSPQLKCGYVTRYDKWLLEKKGIQPEETSHYLSKEDVQEDMVWVEYRDEYEPSSWLWSYLVENHISEDAYIFYCFDN